MSLNLFDRVKETCSAPGTGTVTLLGAVLGFQSFSIVGNANTCYYTIADQYGANWEVGIGTYTLSGTTLARTTVLSSSAGGTTKANFSSGTQDVFVTYPAEKSVYLDSNGNINNLTGNFLAFAGLATTGAFTATPPADGLVMDYAAGYGRFSAFAGDGFKWYNGGVATTNLMTLDSSGNLSNNGNFVTGLGSSPVYHYINGSGSGTAGGADITVQNNGSVIVSMGNYSHIFGGAYNAGAAIYSPAAINYYINSASSIFGISSTGIASQGTIYAGSTISQGSSPTWNAAFQVVQTPACSISTLTNEAFFTGNAYYDSVGWKYTASKPAGYYNMSNTSNGNHIWSTAPSGTAGGAITWTEVMRIDNASGSFLVNTTNTTAKFGVNGSIGIYNGAGTYSLDTSPTGVTIASLGTVNYPNASGVLIVNNWSIGGVGIFTCGGGGTTLITGSNVGALAYNPSINGYTWTNTAASAYVYDFMFIRTRANA